MVPEHGKRRLRVPEEESFTFTWLALKLLGKNLYSNPWSALSELVANGLDARANTVYVYVDVRSKQGATIEVFDDGTGMSRDDIRTYVKVGHNKRLAAPVTEETRPVMGRKGIGKLAALYLSPHFYLRTRHGGSDTSWHLDGRKEHVNDDDLPVLRGVPQVPEGPNLRFWESFASGTFLSLRDVDLAGYGPEAVTALGARLANQFLLPGVGNPQVRLFVHTLDNANEAASFELVTKQIAFRNFAYVATRFEGGHPWPSELSGEVAVSIPADIRGGAYQHGREVDQVEPQPALRDKELAPLRDRVDLQAKTIDGHPYSLEGWVGVHATIESKAAQINDPRFRKNRFYNPAQIRVYVRGKLASDKLLGQLGLTGTYANYIEGEVSFDVLDEDDLPDIATSNRQDFDETDARVLLLRALVRPIARGLMQKRMDLAARIAEMVKEEKERVASAGKAEFAKQVRKELESYEQVPQAVRDELEVVITNKVKGRVEAKDQYRVFLSHSSKDKRLADLVYELLLSRGAESEEVFYTSKAGATEQFGDPRALGAVVKESIVDSNTLLFYLTSRHFKSSEYCMFEGGAGWATRGVTQIIKLNVEYESIPKFLTNSKAEHVLLGDEGVLLTPGTHNYLIERVLNPMIEHLNAGRIVEDRDLLTPFEPVVFPTEVELRRTGTTYESYYNPVIVEHWAVHIEPHIDAYLSDYSS
jgi:hypothetical protein